MIMGLIAIAISVFGLVSLYLVVEHINAQIREQIGINAEQLKLNREFMDALKLQLEINDTLGKLAS